MSKSYPLTVWSGILAHRKRMGDAIWTFIWLIDRTTKEEMGAGYVLGGNKEIRAEDIAKDIGAEEKTARRHLHILAHEGYIELIRAPQGFVIKVKKSKKWIKKLAANNVRSDRTQVDERTATVVRSGYPILSDVEIHSSDLTKTLRKPGATAPENLSEKNEERWFEDSTGKKILWRPKSERSSAA